MTRVEDPHTLEYENPNLGDQPAIGHPYQVERLDFLGRGGGHWSRFAHVDGSYIDGVSWRDLDPGNPAPKLFEKVDQEVRYAPYDLHMMRLWQLSELPLETFIIRNPTRNNQPLQNEDVESIPIGDTISGVKRVWRTADVFAGTDFSPCPGQGYQRNFHTHWMIVNPAGSALRAEAIEELDGVRREFMTRFQEETQGPASAPGRRGSMTSVHDLTVPDLVVSKLTIDGSPLNASPGQVLTVRADVHNQSIASWSAPAGAPGYLNSVRALPASTDQDSEEVRSVSPHQVQSFTYSFPVPSAQALFGSAAYQGSFRVQVLADAEGDLTEGEEVHNARETSLGWKPALSANVATSAGAVQKGPVAGGMRVYVARAGSSGSVIEEINVDDPLLPRVHRSLSLSRWVKAMAARSDLLVLGVGTQSTTPFVTSIDVYNSPLTGAGPRQSLPASSLTSNTVDALAVWGSVLYVGKITNGIDVVSGLSPSGGALSFRTNLFTYWSVFQMRTGGAGSGARLYAATSNGLEEYTISTPESPQYLRTLGSGEFRDCWPEDNLSYLYAKKSGFPGATVSFRLGAPSVQVGQSTDFVYQVTGMALVKGGFLASYTAQGTWTALSTSAGALTFAGTLPTGMGAAPAYGGGAEFRRWAVLADGYGVRLWSPTGVTDLFIRGDANGDGLVDIADSITIDDAVAGRTTLCGLQDAADVNDNGIITTADADALRNYLFLGTSPPRPPFPTAGTDPTSDSLPRYARPR